MNEKQLKYKTKFFSKFSFPNFAIPNLFKKKSSSIHPL
jgi:hypothetical protein